MKRKQISWWLIQHVSNHQNMLFYYHKECILGHWSCIHGNKGMIEEEIHIFILFYNLLGFFICPGHICPYQEYLSCFWLNVDRTLTVKFQNIFWPKFCLDLNSLFGLNFFWSGFFLQKILWTLFLLNKNNNNHNFNGVWHNWH